MEQRDLELLGKYIEIYRFVSPGEKEITEVKRYIQNELNQAESTARKRIKEIKVDPQMFIMENNRIRVNTVIAEKFARELLMIFGMTIPEHLYLSEANEQFDESELENLRLKKDIQTLTTQLETASRRENELKRKITNLEQRVRSAKSMAEKKKKEVAELKKKTTETLEKFVGERILMKESVICVGKNGKEEILFFDEPDKLMNLDACIQKYRPSFYREMEDSDEPIEVKDGKKPGNGFTVKNTIFQSIQRIVTTRLFQKRISDEIAAKVIAKERGINLTKQDQYKEAFESRDKTEEFMAQYYKNRVLSVSNLMANKNMTNQEKLAAYGFFSEYRNTEMQRLLEFAGDNCVPANYVIELLEDPGQFSNYENVRDLFQQLAKTSEYKMKYELAKQLIEGLWYIKAEYNGKMTKFQLVPIEEFNEIREVLELNHSEMTAEEKEEVPQEKPKECEFFDMNEDADEDAPNMDDAVEPDEKGKKVK